MLQYAEYLLALLFLLKFTFLFRFASDHIAWRTLRKRLFFAASTVHRV